MTASARQRLPAALLGVALSASVMSAEPIPETPGWGGFYVAGIGHASLRSNLVAGTRLFDLGKDQINSLDSRPSSDNSFFPLLTGELTYTFHGGWQAFFGTSLEDAVTLDGVTQLGLRKDIGANGILQTGLLLNGVQAKVWEDPYAEGVARERTNRDASGLRLQWSRVMGSAFDVTFSYRDISIDTERSGLGVISVPCDASCQDLLRRDGDQYSFDVSYLFRLGVDRNHLVRPRLRYTIDDRDGDAMAGDSYWLQLSHIYLTPRYTVASNIGFGQGNRDERNPIFGVKTDADQFVLDTSVFVPLPALGTGWQAVASVLWGSHDTRTRFHDTDMLLINFGLLYRAGAP